MPEFDHADDITCSNLPASALSSTCPTFGCV